MHSIRWIYAGNRANKKQHHATMNSADFESPLFFYVLFGRKCPSLSLCLSHQRQSAWIIGLGLVEGRR